MWNYLPLVYTSSGVLADTFYDEFWGSLFDEHFFNQRQHFLVIVKKFEPEHVVCQL